MALQKEKDWKYGLTVNYHIIGSYQSYKLANSTSIVINSYISRQQRLDNINDYCYSTDLLLEGCNYTVEQLYLKVKENLEWFADAIDDIE